MLEDIFGSGLLNIVYAGSILISFIFALISLLGAEIGDAFDFDADVDGGDSGLDFVNVSPFALAMFGATFGLVGLITRLAFEMEALPSILWSTVAGLLVGGLAQAFFVYILSPNKSSHFSLQADAAGREAEVITSIPAEGLGEIAYVNKSGRMKLGARSSKGVPLRTGDLVVIEKIVGRVALVHLEEPEEIKT
jgi:membrane protein implicated in regulation of membrane protease activity